MAKNEQSTQEAYAQSAAELAGLSIDEAWWPAVHCHLAILLRNAALLEAFELDDNEAPAPVFQA